MTRTVERKPKAHKWPLRVFDCPSCGWRSYPTPTGNGLSVAWTTPTECAKCSPRDEREGAATKPETV